MRLTKRCMELFRLLRSARWLTTGQVRRRFFPHATMNAASKRLRKLTEARYLLMVQENRMGEALYTLAGEGKRALEQAGCEDIVLERRPPVQLAHFVGVNQVRIALELLDGISYFFAYWELAKLDWHYPIIPDAVFSLRDRTFAVEFDRGLESIRFFMRTKIAPYRRGFDRFPLAAVLIVTDRKARMESLAKAVADQAGRFLFSTLDLVTQHGMTAPIFFRQPHGEGVSLV